MADDRALEAADLTAASATEGIRQGLEDLAMRRPQPAGSSTSFELSAASRGT